MADAILLTGASSFTGMWIAEALGRRGHHVVAPLRRAEADYQGMRGRRVARLKAAAEMVFDCPFGSPAFLELASGRRWSALAHHAAEVEGHRDWSFDTGRAVALNCAGALEAFRAAADHGARAVVVTGTVFEAGEGGAADNLAANPYGLSKTLTGEAFRHYAAWSGLRFGKFIVPNPVGPLEEKRFVWHLFQTWFAGRTPTVNTPDYVRDNAPAPFLAEAYADYIDRLIADPEAPDRCRPCGWVGTQGAFAQQVAREAGARLGRDLRVELAIQTDHSEPQSRVNCEPCLIPVDIPAFWDDYVAHYLAMHEAGELV